MFKLFNREEMFLHDISPLNAINKEVLNGEDTLLLTINGDIDIDKKYRILVYVEKYRTWKEFIVEEIEEDRVDNLKHIYAENSFYELLGDFIEDKRAINTAANIALERALLTTRWTSGRVDNLGTSTATFYRTNAKDAVQEICIAWKGELKTRIEISGNKIVNRYIDILAQRGNYLGERFVTGENVASINRTISIDSIATALYGYGKGEEIEGVEGESTGGFGRRIDFSSINNGKAYIEDNEARLKWGRLNNDGTRSHIFGKVEFDDCEDVTELLTLTTEHLETLKEPNVIYEGEIIGSVAGLGDTVVIIDNDHIPNLRLTARVFEIESDLLDEGNSKPILGNYRQDISDTLNKQQNFIDNFRDKQGIWDRADSFDNAGNLNTQYLNGVIDVLQNKLLSTLSGWYTDPNGNIVLDAKDGSSSMMLSGAGFMIANSKDATGNWNYRTFGTGNGFVADEIITGILKGGKVKFDLTNGTFLIGNSINDYNLLFDGTNLNIGGNTSISWDNITNQPSIPTTPEELGALPSWWKPTWTDVSGKPSIPTKPSDIGAKPDVWVPTWNDVTGKPYIPTESYITNITKDTITTSYINALGVRAKSLLAGTINIGNNAFQVDVDGWLHAGKGGFSVPPDANGVYNAFTNTTTGEEAARWKYSDFAYIYQSKDNFRVYTRGTIAMELVRVERHAHTALKLMNYLENGALIKALGTDKANEQVQFRNVYDKYYIDIAASNFKVASSAKIKKDITYCKSKLELVKNTPVFNFRLKDDKSNTMNTGFIVESSPSEITTKLGDEDGISIVDTLATLWKAVQELNAKVEKLEGKNNGVRC